MFVYSKMIYIKIPIELLSIFLKNYSGDIQLEIIPKQKILVADEDGWVEQIEKDEDSDEEPLEKIPKKKEDKTVIEYLEKLNERQKARIEKKNKHNKEAEPKPYKITKTLSNDEIYKDYFLAQ